MPERESKIQDSEHVISVHSKKTNQRTTLIEHIPDALAKVIDGLISEWKDLQMTDKVDVKNTVPPEGGKGAWWWNCDSLYLLYAWGKGS